MESMATTRGSGLFRWCGSIMSILWCEASKKPSIDLDQVQELQRRAIDHI